MIQVKNLTKRYGDFCAVNSISFEVERGEIFGFLGVNGAGKTTTIRMLTGILQPTEGEVFIGEYNLQTDANKAKSITGYIPDRPYLYNKLAAREYLYFVADLYHVPAKEAEPRIDALLDEYSLTRWQNELIESFSHGMKQRLATCGALIHKPQVLIVDEPMVGLDPHGAKLLKDRMRAYAEEGMSIFLSTHSLNVAEEVADRLAIIDRGSLLIMGTLSEIREKSGSSGQDLEDMFLKLTSHGMEQ